MFNRRRARLSMADFVQPSPIQAPEVVVDVLIDRPTIQRENTKRLKIDKQEEMHNLREANEIMDKDEIKKNSVLKVENFDSLKQKFMIHKNKSLFIQRNKNVIKSLPVAEQRDFILLAKEHL